MKILLLDTAFSAVPIYSYLTASGHAVWVMGNRAADPLAEKAAANWIREDYSQVNRVTDHITRLGIDCVVPGCTDVSLDTCLRLALNPTLHDSVESNDILANKAEFRRLCAYLELPAPRTFAEQDFPLTGRFICKPVDAFSGRGITVFDGDDLAALADAIRVAKQASATGTRVIETFVEGPLYSCSAFVERRRLTTSFYVREDSSANPYAVDTSFVVHDFDPSIASRLEDSLDRLCSALDLRDGLLHTQFILSGSNPLIVEITRRCPGDLYSLLIEYSTGYPYAAQFASYFIGAVSNANKSTQRHILRHTVTSLDYAHFGGLQFSSSQAVKAFFPVMPVGQPLLPSQRNRAGVLFTEAENGEALAKQYDSFMARTAYKAEL